MTIAAKGAVRKVVVSTLERIGRGSCAEIERRGDIADGGSRAALWSKRCTWTARVSVRPTARGTRPGRSCEAPMCRWPSACRCAPVQ